MVQGNVRTVLLLVHLVENKTDDTKMNPRCMLERCELIDLRLCLRRSPGKCTGASPVYAIGSTSVWCHHFIRRLFSPVRRRHSAPHQRDPGGMRHSLGILDRCSCAVHDWFTHNGLNLNPTKSEILFMGTRQQVDKVSCSEVAVLGCKIVPQNDIKSLGVRLDKNLTFNKHVDETCKSIHYHSRALRHIRGNLNVDTAKTNACAIGSSRLDSLQRDYARNFWDEHDQATVCSKHPSSHSCRMSAERAYYSRSQKTALAPCRTEDHL